MCKFYIYVNVYQKHTLWNRYYMIWCLVFISFASDPHYAAEKCGRSTPIIWLSRQTINKHKIPRLYRHTHIVFNRSRGRTSGSDDPSIEHSTRRAIRWLIELDFRSIHRIYGLPVILWSPLLVFQKKTRYTARRCSSRSANHIHTHRARICNCDRAHSNARLSICVLCATFGAITHLTHAARRATHTSCIRGCIHPN